MKEIAFLMIFAIAFIAFLAYMNLEINGAPENQEPELALNLSSDKEIYHSSEEMGLTTFIKTDTRVENLTIRVHGIKDRSGRSRVNGEKTVNVDPPGTSELFTFQMPSCYGCAGVSPGEYEITFEVFKDGEMVGNFSKFVRLEA